MIDDRSLKANFHHEKCKTLGIDVYTVKAGIVNCMTICMKLCVYKAYNGATYKYSACDDN